MAGRPSIQIVLMDDGDLNESTVHPVYMEFTNLIRSIIEPLERLKIVHIHAADFDPEGNLLRIGDVLYQDQIFPLVTHLLEQIDYRVIVHVNNRTDISMLDPRANIILVPSSPSSRRESKNFWNNLEYLSEDGEILFRIKDMKDFQWMTSCIERYALTERFTIHMLPIDKDHNYAKWSKKLIQHSLGVHLLPWIPFTTVPLKIKTQKHPKS